MRLVRSFFAAQWSTGSAVARRACPSGGDGRGVMVRRPSLASLNGGAELPVCSAVPPASADGGAPGAPPGRPGVPRCARSRRLAPPSGSPGLTPTRAHPGRFAVAVKTAAVSQLPGSFPALAPGGRAHFPSGSACQRDTRYCAVGPLVDFRAGQGGCLRTRDNFRHAGRRPVKRKMVCKEHPCIYAADGYSMTCSASSCSVPRGPRPPRKLTDVHGREG